MNEKLEALNQEIEKTEKKLQRAQHEEKMLEHQIKTLTRKERTHRLCTRAAMLESYLPHPEAITDEQVSLFLKLLFHKDSTRQLMEKVFAGNGNFQGEDAGRKRPWLLSEPQPVDCPSERGRNYTPPEGSVLRPAGASCGKRMIARSVPAPANHHRGSYTSPALAAASYPFVDLPPGNTLRCKLFPFSKFIQIQSQLHFSRLFSNRLIAWSSLLHYN